jgi:gamma-glutamylcyclotransferase (GGCT)/AIG2-like uncharacterized protein YtfP
MHTVFVYGTLKSGEANNNVLRNVDAKLLGNAFIPGTLYDLGPYPGVRLEGAGVVYGELWQVEGDGIRALDRLEGHPTFYHRKPVVSSEGPCEVYEINKEFLNERTRIVIIPNGRW